VAILVFALALWVGRANVRWLIAGAFGACGQSDSSNSPYATAADFARYAMKLRNEGLLKVAPIVQIPRNFLAPWKQNIVTTVFWVGEPAGPNNPVSNDKKLVGSKLDSKFMAALTHPKYRIAGITFRWRLFPDKIRFTSPCRITT